MTKTVTGAAAMLLIEDGAMALDDPVERWLPELGDAGCCGPGLRADDTVPAVRPITVEDVLSFRLGFGCIMTPGAYPVAEAEASLGLKTLGPPWPPTPLTPDEWIAALGGLPLMDQPGRALAVQHRGDGRRDPHRAGHRPAARRGAGQARLRAARHDRHRLLRTRGQARPVH